MSIIQTAERSSKKDPSENVIFQRHLIAYKEAAKLIDGTVLELGSGEGYGIFELAGNAKKYIAIDKYPSDIEPDLKKKYNIEFIQTEVPPISEINDSTIDFVVTFQVIEHIKRDRDFLKEIYRVLKPGGKLILTTPNKNMSITRNPWHVREYDPKEMHDILSIFFSKISLKGIFGNKKVMDYYEQNKQSVKRITKYDIFNMQYWLPRWILQAPYDVLNRINRNRLQINNENTVSSIKHTDYFIDEHTKNCLDHFCIATK